MISIKTALKPKDLEKDLSRFWELSGLKIQTLSKEYKASQGTPVFTVKGKYTTRGWTEWTQGFQLGSALFQFDATADMVLLEKTRQEIVEKMAPHISHIGVHDHGFNNLSTYGNLLRLMHENKIHHNTWEQHFYELALKISGAVQASRWTDLPNNKGYIHSFNGPHSLFVDTVRSCRILVVSHLLGHVFQGEGDKIISLLERTIQHLEATATYAIFYGEGRDQYDLWGRTAHESVFNTKDGQFRCPNAQQGYTGFSTWTRGLAWAMTGFAEQLEAFAELDKETLIPYGGFEALEKMMLKAARATCDFYIEHTPTCGVPYWDTGAPQLHRLGDYLNRPADPYNKYEPVDSSAAAIGAQGLLRLGQYLMNKGETEAGNTYWQAGLTVVQSLLKTPYLSEDPNHHGILLHSIYHQPNGWDHVAQGQKIANGESSMWGDYHMREVAIYLTKWLRKEPYYKFTNCLYSI